MTEKFVKNYIKRHEEFMKGDIMSDDLGYEVVITRSERSDLWNIDINDKAFAILSKKITIPEHGIRALVNELRANGFVPETAPDDSNPECAKDNEGNNNQYAEDAKLVHDVIKAMAESNKKMVNLLRLSLGE